MVHTIHFFDVAHFWVRCYYGRHILCFRMNIQYIFLTVIFLRDRFFNAKENSHFIWIFFWKTLYISKLLDSSIVVEKWIVARWFERVDLHISTDIWQRTMNTNYYIEDICDVLSGRRQGTRRGGVAALQNEKKENDQKNLSTNLFFFIIIIIIKHPANG